MNRGCTININIWGLAVLLALVTFFWLSLPAMAATITWNGYNWAYNGGTAVIDGTGNLVLTADGTVTTTSGTPQTYANVWETDYFPVGALNVLEASFVDPMVSGNGSLLSIKYEYADGTVGHVLIGAGNPSAYIAMWGVRESVGAGVPWVSNNSAYLADRTPGEHTMKIVRNNDGSTQFWFDGYHAVDQSDVLLDTFQLNTLVGMSNPAGSSSSVFTSVTFSTAAAGAPEPSSMLLLGGGMLGLALWQRWQNKKKWIDIARAAG